MSSPSVSLHERIHAAGDSLAQARRLLCEPSPRNLELCCSMLGSARSAIDTVRAEAAQRRPADRGLAGAAAALRMEIGVIGVLLERAANYHANLLKTMVAASKSAVPPETLPQSGRVLIEA